MNFSSSESFVRALGGGQWLNGDVSRKVDSRERPALYRPSIHPLLFALHRPPPSYESAEARAHGPISSRKNIYSRKRERGGGRETEKEPRTPSESRSNRRRLRLRADFDNPRLVSADYMYGESVLLDMLLCRRFLRNVDPSCNLKSNLEFDLARV